VAKRLKAPAEAVSPDTCVHDDDAGRHIGQANLDLGARPPLAQHDGSTVVEADEMEGILADVEAKRGEGGRLGFGYADHGIGSLLLFPPQRGDWSTAGHPISALRAAEAEISSNPGMGFPPKTTLKFVDP